MSSVMVTARCEYPGCDVALSGFCAQGNDPIESCPYFKDEAAFDDDVADDSRVVRKSSGRDLRLRSEEPLPKIPHARLTLHVRSGRHLDIDQCTLQRSLSLSLTRSVPLDLAQLAVIETVASTRAPLPRRDQLGRDLAVAIQRGPRASQAATPCLGWRRELPARPIRAIPQRALLGTPRTDASPAKREG